MKDEERTPPTAEESQDEDAGEEEAISKRDDGTSDGTSS
jgi:hypothetical protein